MVSHDDRMRKLSRFQLPSDPLVLAKIRRAAEQDIATRVFVKDRWKVTYARAFTQQHNGSGLLMSKVLREFVLEFNDRVWSHGLRSGIMPGSFNVVEAFVYYMPGLSMFLMHNENEHILNFEAFLDYATLKSETDSSALLINSIAEGLIYNYNVCNSLDAIMFQGEGKSYAVGGFSLIRHGHEVSIVMAIGEKSNVEEKTAEIKQHYKDSRLTAMPGKEKLTPSSDLEIGALPLLEDKRFARAFALARFDLKASTYESRYILFDEGDRFNVLSDDNGYFEGSTLTQEHIEEIVARISSYQEIFNLCKICIQAPLYFQDNLTAVKFEQRPTDLKLKTNSPSFQRQLRHCQQSDKILVREINVLDMPSEVQANQATYSAPNFEVENRGWWRALRHDEVGIDKDGNPIHGRTWVVEKTVRIRTDRTKYVVTSPRLGQRDSVSNNPNAGCVYVMRCIAHIENLFKVGLTQRDSLTRASELTASTSAPSQFHVVYEWQFSDCISAEKEIHDRLAAYRFNERREFFQAPLQIITNTLQEVAKKQSLE